MVEKKIRIDSEKREIPIHIHQGFPIGIITSDFGINGYDYVDWHWHEEIQYCIVLNGEFAFNIADKKIIVKEGNGIFINSHQIHKIEALTKEASFLFIYFHPSILTNQKDSYIFKTYISTILTNEFAHSILLEKDKEFDKKIIDLVLEINSIYMDKYKLYELDILSLLIRVWKNTIYCADDKKLMRRKNDMITNDRLKKIISYIDENYMTQISLDDIAEYVNISNSECSRFFKKCIGESLFQYIVKYRINKSMDYLLNTDRSIADIAYNVGFNSQSYYTKCFTDIKKKTPKKMRKEFKDKKKEEEYLKRIDNK